MRRSGFFGILLLALVALVGGIIGYQAGLTSSAAASGATVVVTGGLPGFGTLFFLLFIGFLFFAARGRRSWAHGHGPWAGRPGAGWPGIAGDTGDAGDPRRQWVADLHRRLHEEEAAVGRAGGSAGS
jgi:hypothetical protein